MLGNIKSSFLFVLFPLFITTFQIHATPNCLSDIDTPVCVDEVGFYYLLGNGTWNVSLIEGKELKDRESFLSKLQNNQCPISASTSASNCDNDCCYCILRLPLPHHAITDRVLVPEHLTCLERMDDDWKYQNWHLTREAIQQCKTGDPVRLPFFCVLMDNLEELKLTYNNPQILNQISYYQDIRQKRPALSWRNTSAIAAKAEAVNQTIWKTVVGEPTVDSKENISIITEKLSNGFDYSWFRNFDELGQEMDNLMVDGKSVSNLTVNFSGRTECLSKHRKWDSYLPCSYTINATHFSECSHLKNAVYVVSRIIYNYISDTSTHVIEEGACFEAAEFIFITNELKVTAAVWQHIVTEKDYTNLSKFWTNFYFGDCLFRRCWRDLWNILPENLLRNFVFKDGDNGSFRWGFFLPVLLICFVLVVRANLISSVEVAI